MPLISSGCAGPLGLLHLPRMWWTTSLRAADDVWDDELCAAVGLDRARFIEFVAATTPDYLTLEHWVQTHAGELRPDTIAAFNATISAAALLEQHLRDWAAAHAQLDQLEGPVVPLISSSCKGPLGIIHLPRLWWKRILDESGKLQDGYRCSALGGFDGSCSNALGLDRDAFDRWLRHHRPTYLAVEAYVREHAPPENLTPQALRTFNERILAYDIRTELAEARRDRFALDLTWTRAIPLNDLDDWAGAHRRLNNVPVGDFV
ncbi:MAG TPA: hypothetical protein VN742_11415 [Candidatus Binataceae bacterium]|nr:hypothetical protein [Candidatus Binataceae bacterium]